MELKTFILEVGRQKGHLGGGGNNRGTQKTRGFLGGTWASNPKIQIVLGLLLVHKSLMLERGSPFSFQVVKGIQGDDVRWVGC